ncbi:hypothetical protein GCM10010321_80390 [Streptomyces chartreusis]|nr:hypothetical protein GCM10010321_80390 [Streptomyces chartreusis]
MIGAALAVARRCGRRPRRRALCATPPWSARPPPQDSGDRCNRASGELLLSVDDFRLCFYNSGRLVAKDVTGLRPCRGRVPYPRASGAGEVGVQKSMVTDRRQRADPVTPRDRQVSPMTEGRGGAAVGERFPG